jgi:hypothetical protein
MHTFVEMKDKLNNLSKEDLVEILFRVYDVHQKDVEFYTVKEDKILLGVHQSRVERIDRYVDSALNKNERE